MSSSFSHLREYLDSPHPEIRTRVLELMREDVFRVPAEAPRSEHRAQVLKALARLAEEGLGRLSFPEAYGGSADPGASIAVFETLALGDTSILVKFGVQFGLWGGSVLQLGTQRHHQRFLKGIGSLDIPGCYAMTEIGHGSNVRELETTAVYDPEAGEFVVDTPHEAAGKEWIGNAALHGRWATVFAQLEVDGVEHGVHALVVPLRDERGRVLPGIRIEDNGAKAGLNGVDNGRIWFDGVRVPRENLLDRFAQVDAAGVYQSPIESPGRRFFTMLGTLVAGRISIAAASVSAAKVGLTAAVRYSSVRRQFGPEGQPEVPVLDYRTHQRLLVPRVARTYALHFAVRDLVRRYVEALDTPAPDDVLPGEETRGIEAAAAGLKAVASWHGLDALQAAREAMGGRGFDARNRIGPLRADTDIFTTFEGANPVLLQLVAKSLLTRFRDEMGDLRPVDWIRYVAERAGTRVTELNPVVTRRTDPDHLRDPEFHLAAFEYREERILVSAARRLRGRIQDGMDPFQAFNECQDHLVTLGIVHAERLILECFQDAVTRAPSPGASEPLRDLSLLYALDRIEADRAWFLEAGYLDPPKSKAIRTQVSELCAELREGVVALVDAWGIPDEILGVRDGLRSPPRSG